ncbi:MAG: NAD-glutamate dehydrogenase [Pseudomonadota bacterium]
MPEGFLTDVDDEILLKVIEKAKQEKIGDFTEKGEPCPAFLRYLEQLVRYATGEDVIWSDPTSLLARADSAWDHGKIRKEGDNKVSLRIEENGEPAERRLVLDIITDDKPFLVDSVSAALADAGKPLSFFSNAVIDIHRNAKGERQIGDKGPALRESMIHAEMDPPVTEGELDHLHNEITAVLEDVSNAVSDWEPMRSRLAAAVAQLERSRLRGVKADDQREAIEFLKWLWDNRFAFLGYRRFDRSDDGFVHDDSKDLGVMKDSTLRILRNPDDAPGTLSPAVEAFLKSDEPVIVAKANTKSLVHRRAYLDYIGVKTYSVDGTVTGEDRFVGLFTSDAYFRPASEIPLIRSKLRTVIDSTDFNPGGHNEKALINILETFPRDELFQSDTDTLREISLGILRLYKRPRVKLFLRRDRFDRFISALVYIPRDRFNSDIREQIGDLLSSTFHGAVSTFSPFFGDAALVRVHFIINIAPGAPEGPGLPALTEQIRQICRNWNDDLLESMRAAHDGALPVGLYNKYERAFGAGYRERARMDDTLRDISCLEALEKGAALVRAYRDKGDADHVVRLKIYRCGGPFPLSRLIPTIENLGLSVIQEAGYNIRPPSPEEPVSWIHDFHTEQRQQYSIDLDDVKEEFEKAILAVLDGKTEDDGFNALVLTAGVSWREAWLLRAAAKYNVQTNFAYSQAYMEEALANHPHIVRALVSSFHARFNPAGPSSREQRAKDVEIADNDVLSRLNDVQSLADDRIFRRFLSIFSAILRTNYYQQGNDGAAKPYISFKVNSSALTDLPEPKPYREIFVSGPRVDGVHLRFGPVARGGLRWSDRREDFRTEVLGLVKAQRVKNAVIVPTGAKGGFFPKQLPQTDDRAAIYEEGREAYKLFIAGLLDLTDNIVKNKIISPLNTFIWDDPDPYLVVAADKGTAQFSDTANAISEAYGFWLGDAFASGGSAGYDHKVMGITARGAWEAVKRHFREMGKDIQTEPFTAAGVGDMSGDVFGNGMLLSDKTRLIAAFDHRDIFIDPDPDPAKSFKERKRLFELPRSSWNNYDKKLISKGGGVFPRSAKSVTLTPQIKKLLNTTEDKLAPNELIQAILRAPVELFWLGGIGTYFKAESEDNLRVGDRANDPVRINARESGAKVIGEGANLGLTQKARIEFARSGGRINTDAIDNSAGVDSSDHEVNIKILLSSAIEQAELKTEDRNDLLASMTDDVADHVLLHNYEQTRAVTLMHETAPSELDTHTRLMNSLERTGRLNRIVEDLPSAEDIATLRQQNLGLTRPELSVLLAYAKLWVFDELVASTAPDDPIFEHELFAYFPKALHGFTKPLVSHRLRREIIATRVANDIIDTCGAAFLQRVLETEEPSFELMALAYEAARSIFNLSEFASSVNTLDNKVSADLQTALYLEASDLLREQVFHLLSDKNFANTVRQHGVKAVISRYRAPVTEFKKALPDVLGADDSSALHSRYKSWLKAGAPDEIAGEAAALPALEHALDIVDLAANAGWSNPGVGALYFKVGQAFFFDALREKARNEMPSDHYNRIALRQLADDLTSRQRALTETIVNFTEREPKGPPTEWATALIARWRECGGDTVKAFDNASSELDITGPANVGKYTLFIRRLDILIEQNEC